MARVLILRSRSVDDEPRAWKVYKALRDGGFSPEILVWERRKCFKKDNESVRKIYVGECDYERGIFNLSKRVLFFKALLNFLKNCGNSYDILYAMDMDTAFPAVLAKRKFKFSYKIIYDICDFIYYWRTPGSFFLRPFLRFFDVNYLMREVEYIIVPFENRLSFIPAKWRNKTEVITNSPDISSFPRPEHSSSDMVKFIDRERINVFYPGTLSRDCGVHFLPFLAEECENLNLIVAGSGALEREMKRVNLKNFKFLGKLRLEEVYSVYPMVDIIYVLYDPSRISNRFSAPTKLFEGLYFKKPPVVSRGTYWDEEIERYDCGFVSEFKLKNLINLFKNLKKYEIEEKAANTHALLNKYRWELSREKLLKICSLCIKR